MVKAHFDFKQFRKNVEKDFNEIRKNIHSLELGLWNRMHSDNEAYYRDEEDELTELAMEAWLEAAELKLRFAYEYLYLPDLRKKLDLELLPHKEDIKKLDFYPAINVFYSRVLEILHKHLEAILSQTLMDVSIEDTGMVSNQLMLMQIIKRISKLLTDLKIVPHNERVIHDLAYNILVHVFPDIISDNSISNATKIYKPVLGIRSLKTAIEFKFVDSKTESGMGSQLEEYSRMYTDMMGLRIGKYSMQLYI